MTQVSHGFVTGDRCVARDHCVGEENICHRREPCVKRCSNGNEVDKNLAMSPFLLRTL